MKNKKLTVTIGIPAYNEEANIKFLLKSLLKQKLSPNIKLQEIILISDGSIDNTVSIARSIKNARIEIISFKKRRGLNQAQNEILAIARGDILVILNADVLPNGDHFINEIIKPILKNDNVGLVGAGIIPLQPKTLIGKILLYSHLLKQYLYRRINNSNNVYLCRGQARAFSKKYYSKIIWPENCPEDSYSYFFCREKGFQFIYNPHATVFFMSSETVQDHIKQTNRFIYGKEKLEDLFTQEYIKQQYYISYILIAQALIIFLIKNPALIFGYLLLLLYVRLFKKKAPLHHSRYEISTSSKRLI